MKVKLKVKYIFPHRLNQARHANGLTRSDLQNKTGIKKKMLAKYELGENMPTIPILCKIADALDVSTDWLLGRVDDFSESLS